MNKPLVQFEYSMVLKVPLVKSYRTSFAKKIYSRTETFILDTVA